MFLTFQHQLRMQCISADDLMWSVKLMKWYHKSGNANNRIKNITKQKKPIEQATKVSRSNADAISGSCLFLYFTKFYGFALGNTPTVWKRAYYFGLIIQEWPKWSSNGKMRSRERDRNETHPNIPRNKRRWIKASRNWIVFMCLQLLIVIL